MEVLYVLWLRQMKRYLRSRARIVGSLGQPLLFLVALGFGFGPIYARAGGGDYIAFLSPGVIAMAILFTAVFSGVEVLWDKQFGFLKETLVAPVSRLQVMLGRTLGGATVATVQGVIVLLLALFVGFRPSHAHDIPLALMMMFLTALLFTALGTAVASVLDDFQGFQLVMNFVVMPLFFLSGALFPLDGIPGAIGLAAHFNPLSYGVDGIRGALVGGAHFSLLVDTGVLALAAALVLAAGAFCFTKIQV
jgi:ABC-2 type transport system permease protein